MDIYATLLPTLFNELVHGSPDPAARTFILNKGDNGLLASLDRLSAAEASAAHGGASIAAHVDHLRYGLSLLNGWAAGSYPPWPAMDFTESWRRPAVSDEEWQSLRDQLRREADAWAAALRRSREVNEEVNEVEAGWIAGSVAHLAYHMGAIRQINRATRGPTAEDEAGAQADQR